MITIRSELPQDANEMFLIYVAAFGRFQEAALVDALRKNHAVLFSLVAVDNGGLVGGVVFSTITLEPPMSNLNLAGLAPLAVLPSYQQQGIGSQLVRAGLQQGQELNLDAVFLVGKPDYYTRFGFVPASDFGIACEFEVPEAYWLVKELRPQVLSGLKALARFRPEFQRL
jgi:putative acetyltransferase